MALARVQSSFGTVRQRLCGGEVLLRADTRGCGLSSDFELALAVKVMTVYFVLATPREVCRHSDSLDAPSGPCRRLMNAAGRWLPLRADGSQGAAPLAADRNGGHHQDWFPHHRVLGPLPLLVHGGTEQATPVAGV